MKVIEYIFTTIIPIILTGIVTGVVRKNENQNIRNEKKEIAYDKVYYPLSVLVRNTNYDDVNHEKMVKKIGKILKRNDKYISRITYLHYDNYLKSIKNGQIKKISKKSYDKLLENIIEYNYKLRRQLGYVNASFFESLKSLSTTYKYLFLMFILVCVMYVFAVIYIFYSVTWIKVTLVVLLFLVCICCIVAFICKIVDIIDDFYISIIIKKNEKKMNNEQK